MMNMTATLCLMTGMRETAFRLGDGRRVSRRGVVRFAVLAALLAIGLAGQPVQAQDLTATWQGTMQAGKGQRIVVQISKATAGWQGVVYNLDSDDPTQGLVTKRMSLQGGELQFAMATVDDSYDGKLSGDGTAITGTMTLSGKSFTLNLARATGDAVWEIPKAGARMAKDADPDWEVISIHARDANDPGNNSGIRMNGRQFEIENKTVEVMMIFAYGMHKNQILGAPHWFETDRWDVRGVPDTPGIRA